MIPVFVSGDQQVDMVIGCFGNVVDHFLHDGSRIACTQHHAAINQDVERFARGWHGDEETVAESLTVHADAKAGGPWFSGGPPRNAGILFTSFLDSHDDFL